jgi:hypothetical protein
MNGDQDEAFGATFAYASGQRRVAKWRNWKVYPGFSHGVPSINGNQINADFAVFKQKQVAA